MKFSELDHIPDGVNPATCYHYGEDTNNVVCGALATNYLPMPGPLMDMPLCDKHFPNYQNITKDRVIELINLVFEEKEEDDEF